MERKEDRGDHEGMVPIASVPPEILDLIFQWLTVEQQDGLVWITVCRFVCTLWRAVLTSFPSLPQYLRSYFEQRWLLDAREGLKVKPDWNPLHITCVLAERGMFSLLEWAVESGCPLPSSTCAAAARGGQLDILKWLRARRCKWSTHEVIFWGAWGGHLDLLVWARENGPSCNFNQQLQWDPTCAAATRGHLHVLTWLKNEMRIPISSNTSKAAAEAGQIEVLKWMKVMKFDRNYALQPAVKGGQLHVLKWLEGEGHVPIPWHGSQLYTDAILNNQFEVVKWLHSQGYLFTETCCALAARKGDLDLLKWLRERGCPWGALTLLEAAGGGYLAVLRYAMENGCFSSSDIATQLMTRAMESGNLDMLKYLKEKGYPWPSGFYEKAAARGYLDILKWLHQNGCPCPTTPASFAAATNGHLSVLLWLYTEHGMKLNTGHFEAAAEGGHVEVLTWLKENGCQWKARACAKAAGAGKKEALQWLRANGCPWDWRTITRARAGKHYDVAEWAERNGCPLPKVSKRQK